MKSSQIFLGPGKWIVTFLLSLVEIDATSLPPQWFWALSVLAAVIFWVQVCRIAVALARRFTGFDQRPQR
jgi:lipid-A-disaccharide synthase-like uncharacterized protein